MNQLYEENLRVTIRVHFDPDIEIEKVGLLHQYIPRIHTSSLGFDPDTERIK